MNIYCTACTHVTREAVNLIKLGAPVVARAGQRGLTSLSCKSSEVQKNVWQSMGLIRAKQSLMEANAKRRLILLEATVIEWEKKFKSGAFHSLKLVTAKGCQVGSGQSD